jgi:sortase A
MKWLRLFGKFLISVGVGVLLFVGWTLWGTGLYTRHQQSVMAEEYDKIPLVEDDDPTDDEPPGPPPGFAENPGDPAFKMRIPRIWGDKTWVVVEGVDVASLQKGPGHYASCRPGIEPPCSGFEEAWPGLLGRVIVSAHRTTFLAPFYDLNELRPGDPIITDTKWGVFTYRVMETKIVDDQATTVVIPNPGAYELVLTTCNPRFSAAERLVVYAEMERPIEL